MLVIDQDLEIINNNHQLRKDLDKFQIWIYLFQNQIKLFIIKIKMILKIFLFKANSGKDFSIDELIHQDGNFFTIFTVDFT